MRSIGASIGLLTVLCAMAWAGGSGLNVVVVVNQRSTNSLQLANAFCEMRGVPPQNVFRMTGWTGGNVGWGRTFYEPILRDPLLNMINSRGLTNQVNYILLSMDIPYAVSDGTSVNSTTSALFYGFKTNSTPPAGLPSTCSLPDASTNSYYFSELAFPGGGPQSADTNSYLAAMLTDATLAEAESILARGISSDGVFPQQPVVLAKTSDVDRNVRYPLFDNAVFDSRVAAAAPPLERLTGNSTTFTNVFGLQTGLAEETFPPDAFLPGAIADTLTSSGGNIFENLGQTTLLAFLNAGASISYGAVIEPCNYTQKFPDPCVYNFQRRGFSLAEAYYQSVQNPYQGLMVGEPLAAPFARPGFGAWNAPAEDSTVAGSVPLDLTFAATNAPLAQVDLFLDGKFLQTLTHLAPTPGNVISVTLNGVVTDLTITNAVGVGEVATALTALLNTKTNSTRVLAVTHGDRIELESLDPLAPGARVSVATAASAGSAASLTTYLSPALPACLDTTAKGYHYIFITNNPAPGDWIQLEITKTNGAVTALAATNTTAGTTIGQLLQSLIAQVSAAPALQLADGVAPSDFLDYKPYGAAAAEVFLYARTPGWPAAQVQVVLSTSTNLIAQPGGTNRLDDNVTDLRPRNHLYLAAGASVLPVRADLDTSALPDGFHELTAVAYEGNSVRTQTRISRRLQFTNTGFAATFTTLYGASNTDLGATLQFRVAANHSDIARIELFTTGGSVGVVTNQSTATFAVAGADLGLGLHPFYALVTGANGAQYRTQTQHIRLVSTEPPISVSISAWPPTLTWPATAGRSYDVLSATNVSGPFEIQATVVPSLGSALWSPPSLAPADQFYYIRTSR